MHGVVAAVGVVEVVTGVVGVVVDAGCRDAVRERVCREMRSEGGMGSARETEGVSETTCVKGLLDQILRILPSVRGTGGSTR